MSDILDLGSGFSLRFTSWGPDRELNPQYAGLPDVDKAGAIVTCPHSEGAILFDTMTDAHGFAGRPRWTVESWEPLTLSPSIACRNCGCHGFIREGRWVPA